MVRTSPFVIESNAILSLEPFKNKTTTFGFVASVIIISLSIRDAPRESKTFANNDELACPKARNVNKRMKSVAIIWRWDFMARSYNGLDKHHKSSYAITSITDN